MPIKWNDEILGVLQMVNKAGGSQPFNKSDERIFEVGKATFIVALISLLFDHASFLFVRTLFIRTSRLKLLKN